YGRTFQTVRLTLSCTSLIGSRMSDFGFRAEFREIRHLTSDIQFCGPATPRSPFELRGLGCSDFARHYFRNHGCCLFLRVLRWFTSPGSLRHPMDSDDGNRCSQRLGFPIRTSPDHGLLAAPRGLSQLTASFLAYLRQGIHTHTLSSLTIKSILNTDVLSSALCIYL